MGACRICGQPSSESDICDACDARMDAEQGRRWVPGWVKTHTQKLGPLDLEPF
jgi:hypothetical protein